VLYEHSSTTEHYTDKHQAEHGLRRQQFYFLSCVIVKKSDRDKLIDILKAEANLDVSDWEARSFTDEPFLREAPWRDTWDQDQWSEASWKLSKGILVSSTAYHYQWESHLDAALPTGAQAAIISPWLAKALSLAPEVSDGSVYKDQSGKIEFWGTCMQEGGSSALISSELLQNYLKANSLECLWTFVAERNAWPSGGNSNAAWRRAEGLVWLDNDVAKCASWKHDHANGASKGVLAKMTNSKRPKDTAKKSSRTKLPKA
jgi:hypothetical protein